jgi:hypothetical protein
MNYDLIIVGAGPAGLALAHYCASKNLKIIIIDRENSIGGCHRVRRIKYKDEEIFTEHGPRIYLSSFVNFMELLNEFGYNFDELFQKDDNIDTFKIMNENLFPIIKIKEVFILIFSFIIYLFNSDYGTNVSMHDYMSKYNFSQKTYNFINKLCISTDGGDAYKYSLNKFLKGSDQNLFYSGYLPKLPNDKGLFKIWKENLNDVEFLLNTEIINITENSVITKDNKIIKGSKIIFAIPPMNLIKILNNIPNNIRNCFGDINDLNKWSNNTKYMDYISVTFHWNQKIKLNDTTNFATNTEWSILQDVMSDVMVFDNKSSKTVISCAITERDVKSKRINKTANECTKKELIDEIYYQLLSKFPNLPTPTISVLSPGNYINNNKWIDIDTAFIATPNNNYIPFQSKTIPSLYNLGTHNGNSYYNFTSMETAVSNAKSLALKLYPDLNIRYQIKKPFWTLKNVLLLIILIIIIYIVIHKLFL